MGVLEELCSRADRQVVGRGEVALGEVALEEEAPLGVDSLEEVPQVGNSFGSGNIEAVVVTRNAGFSGPRLNYLSEGALFERLLSSLLARPLTGKGQSFAVSDTPRIWSRGGIDHGWRVVSAEV